MPDDKEIPVETPAETPPETPTPPPPETPTPSETPEDVVEIKRVVKDADGNFVFIVDPTDSKSTVYKGKTIDELFDNASQGIKEKDSYINKLKSQGIVSPKEEPAREATTEFPEYGQILDKTLKEFKIDPRYLEFGDDDWKKLEEEYGVRKVLQIEGMVQRAKQTADQRYAELNLHAINDATLDDETDVVAETLAEYGIAEDQFADKFREITRAVLSEKSNFKATGVLKSGRIALACIKEIKKLSSEQMVSDAKKKAEAEIARDRSIKGRLSTEGPSRAPFNKPTDKVYKNNESILDELLAEVKLGRK